MKINELKAHKAKLVKEMRSLADHDELTSDQEQRFDNLKKDLESTESKIEKREFLAAMEKTETPDPAFDAEKRGYSILRAIAGQAGLDVDCGREREVSQELSRRYNKKAQGILVPHDMPMERRTDIISTDLPAAGPGSNITPDDYRPGLFIDALRAALVIRRLGCTVLSGLSGKLVIPAHKTSTTGFWVAENAAVTASDMQFQQVTLEPRTAGALVEISRQMLMQSSPDVETLAKNDLAAVLAQAIDVKAINGDGSGSDEPLGIFQQTGVATVDVSGGWTWANILSFIEEVEKENASGTAWLTRAEVVKSFRSTPKETAIYFDTGDAAAVSADYFMDGPSSLAGYPLYSTQNVPTDQIAFGKWSDLILGMFGPLDVLVNPYESTAYTKGNVQVRLMQSCDVAVRHAESFCIADLSG
jgi:HK97 family phage major capsid protein